MKPWLNFCATACLTLPLIVGCSNVIQKPAQLGYSSDITEVLSGNVLIGHEVTANELPNIDLFAITSDMATFAETAVIHADSTYDKVKALHTALLSPASEGGREISYNAFATETPINTFNERKANCLSFSLLYVALARHLGIQAYINEVEVPPTWDIRDSGQLYYMQHVNIKIPLRNHMGKGYFWLVPDEAIIDLQMSLYKPTYPQKTISDKLIATKFYSNRGMEFAAEGNYENAFLYLRKALQENDQQSSIWNNFASLYRKNELFQKAEMIYLHGLQLNPKDLTIMNNLAGIYHLMGKTEQALKFNDLAKSHRQANPYYQYILAQTAYDKGDYAKALTHIKRAIDREKSEPRFYQLISSIYQRLGEPKAGEAMNKRYQALLVQAP